MSKPASVAYDSFGNEVRKPWEHAHEVRLCSHADLFKITGESPEGFLESVDKYLGQFAAPIRTDDGYQLCLHCGEQLTGMMAGLLGRGGFSWGIAHGEGYCAGCYYPARAHHFPKDDAGEELFALRNFVLQYLPDAEAEAEAAAKAAA